MVWKVLFFGNGGSAGDSQHMAGEIISRFLKDRSYLKAVKILAKHDENYMPPEVNEALKLSLIHI